MKSGEIWVINSGDSNGHEQSGIRPAVVVSAVVARIVMVVPITSNSKALRFAHTIQLSPNTSNNLSESSIAMVFQLRAIDVKRLEKKIGILTVGELKMIKREVRNMLQL